MQGYIYHDINLLKYYVVIYTPEVESNGSSCYLVLTHSKNKEFKISLYISFVRFGKDARYAMKSEHPHSVLHLNYKI